MATRDLPCDVAAYRIKFAAVGDGLTRSVQIQHEIRAQGAVLVRACDQLVRNVRIQGLGPHPTQGRADRSVLIGMAGDDIPFRSRSSRSELTVSHTHRFLSTRSIAVGLVPSGRVNPHLIGRDHYGLNWDAEARLGRVAYPYPGRFSTLTAHAQGGFPPW